MRRPFDKVRLASTVDQRLSFHHRMSFVTLMMMRPSVESIPYQTFPPRQVERQSSPLLPSTSLAPVDRHPTETISVEKRRSSSFSGFYFGQNFIEIDRRRIVRFAVVLGQCAHGEISAVVERGSVDHRVIIFKDGEEK